MNTLSVQSAVSSSKNYNTIVLLGPTAVGKTSLAVRIADHYGWDIISADSRQVYKGLDIGSGKDLAEYTFNGKTIPYHLIDTVSLAEEYSVFDFQRNFYELFDSFTTQDKVPFVVGGTGMYVDSIIRGYELVEVPDNPKQRAELEAMTLPELSALLRKIKPHLHNTSDLADKERAIHAIEIQLYILSDEYKAAKAKSGTQAQQHGVNAFVIGTTLERSEVRKNISIRLRERLDAGMIEEVEGLHNSGYSWERLERLGLEYRFVSEYLEGKITGKEELFTRLEHAIHQFAKRQETWFRGMERKGVEIHWLPLVQDKTSRYNAALDLIDRYF